MSYQYPPQDLGVMLDVNAAALTTDYDDNATAPIAARGCAGLASRCAAAFDGASTLTSISFQWQTYNTATEEWDAIAGVDERDGSVVEELTFLAADGDAAAGFSTPSGKASPKTKLCVKHTGGSPSGDDAASASVTVLP